jgi:hypothetical protein
MLKSAVRVTPDAPEHIETDLALERGITRRGVTSGARSLTEPNMRIYLAARYSRRLELCGYRDELQKMGHTVQAVWLNGEHQISDTGTPIGEHGESLVEGHLRSGERLSPEDKSERAGELRSHFANEDFRDVINCQLLIAFTEPPRSEASRGGRHVELGIALGRGKLIAVVGPRENIFCWLEYIRQFDTWEQCKEAINRLC